MQATVYSTSTCAWCDRVVQLLKDHDVETDKVSVDKDPANLKEMHIQCGGSKVNTVPQDVIDGKHRLARAYQQGERTVRVREVCMKKAPRNMRILFLQKNYERSN